MEIKNVTKIIKLKFYVKLSSGVLANLPAVLARSSAAASARFRTGTLKYSKDSTQSSCIPSECFH